MRRRIWLAAVLSACAAGEGSKSTPDGGGATGSDVVQALLDVGCGAVERCPDALFAEVDACRCFADPAAAEAVADPAAAAACVAGLEGLALDACEVLALDALPPECATAWGVGIPEQVFLALYVLRFAEPCGDPFLACSDATTPDPVDCTFDPVRAEACVSVPFECEEVGGVVFPVPADACAEIWDCPETT